MKKIIYRFHAVQRMFQRGLPEESVAYVIKNGKIIEDYPDDKPYPSSLKLGFIESEAIHVVCSESDEAYIVITAYKPTLYKWQSGYEKRR